MSGVAVQGGDVFRALAGLIGLVAVSLASPAARAEDPLDLVTDCDRLASSPADPQRPHGVPGVDLHYIDIGPALAACKSATSQYPDVARFAYQLGRSADVQSDYARARLLYDKAASMGSIAAINNIGAQYYFGHGVPQDYAEAMRWFKKAADAGLPFAYGSIALLYDTGRGVEQDSAEARRWYEKAANAGDRSASLQLGDLYARAGNMQDLGEAIKSYKKAALAGSPDAMFRLALIYETGQGVAQDRAAAEKWYEMSAQVINGTARK